MTSTLLRHSIPFNIMDALRQSPQFYERKEQFLEAQSNLPDGQKIVGIREFITHPDYLGKGDSFWPGILEDLEAMTQPGIIGAWIEQGIGGGKSYRFAGLLCYFAYLIQMWRFLGKDIRDVTGNDPSMPLDMVNVSVTASQAKDVIFGKVSALIDGTGHKDGSPWFKEYCPRDKSIDSRLRFPTGNFNIIPGHSKDTSVIGRDLFVALFDEANFFKKSALSGAEDQHPADVLYDAMERRIRSRFGLHGFMGVCSSVKTINDFTRERMAGLRTSEDGHRFYMPPARPVWALWPESRLTEGEWKCFDIGATDWSGSPAVQYHDTPEETVTKTQVWVPRRYWKDFETKPEDSLRDHVSIPPDAHSPFFRRSSAIKPDFGDEDNPPLANPICAGVRAEDWCRDNINFNDFFEDWFVGVPGILYHFHYDPSKSGDASGFVMSHLSGQVEVTDHTPEELDRKDLHPSHAVMIDVDCIVRIKAPKGGEIPQSVFRRLVIFLRDERGFRFGRCSSDSWQSLDGHQILRQKGFTISTLSVDSDRSPYETVKTLLYDDRLFLPPAKGQTPQTTSEQLRLMAKQGDPCAIVQVELKELEDIKGNKIEHPTKGSKDLSDALAGSVYNCILQRWPTLNKSRKARA